MINQSHFVMSIRYAAILVLTIASSISKAQTIPLQKLIALEGNDGTNAINFLQLAGYDLGHKQDDNNSEIIFTYWDYKTDSLEYHIVLGIDRKFQVVQTIDYQFYKKKEYLNLLSLLLSGPYPKKGAIQYHDRDMYQDFICPSTNRRFTNTLQIRLTNTRPPENPGPYDYTGEYYSLSIYF